MQVKLLRAIQEKSVRPVGSPKEVPVNVRIVSATHRDLATEVVAGRFRQDLFYRINVIQLKVPPLRERGDDILYLAQTFLKKLSSDWGMDEPALSEAARSALRDYAFPGNVRELQNILERALTLCDHGAILPEHLQLPEHGGLPETREGSGPALAESHGGSLEDYLFEIEKSAILKALEETRWNRTAAAKKLGMTFRSLRYRLKKMGLDDDSADEDEK
jgi:two-component system response regulator PilR (NtrC family)